MYLYFHSLYANYHKFTKYLTSLEKSDSNIPVNGPGSVGIDRWIP